MACQKIKQYIFYLHVYIHQVLQTSFFNLLPAEVVSPNYREQRVIAVLGHHLDSIFQLAGLKTWCGGLDVTDDIYFCKTGLTSKNEQILNEYQS